MELTKSSNQVVEIQKQFNRVIECSQGFYPNTDKLFEDWIKNKEQYVKWLGGLIYEYPNVSFELSETQKDSIVREFLVEVSYLLSNEEFSELQKLVLNNLDSFFKNIISFAYENGPIKKGMRLSKAFKYIIKDKELMTQIQQIASSYIQKGKVSGTLCLSVHPLDFLSISENNCNWRSCHALDGEYCAGNLSYMADNSTVICYLKTHEDVQLHRFPAGLKWNNKKWRMLLFFGKEFNPVFLGRQYPFDIDGIQAFIESKILKNAYYDFQNDYIEKLGNIFLPTEYIALESGHGVVELVNKFDVILDSSTLHYNDLLQSNYYKPYYTSKKNNFKKIRPVVNVGHKVLCLNCGQHEIFSGNKEMVCEYCSDEAYENHANCAICGDRGDVNNMYYMHDGQYVCQICYEEEQIGYCYNCDEFFYENELIFNENDGHCYCKDCYEDLKEEL